MLQARPDWAARDRDGGILTKNGFEWMNALHPDVQEFMIELILEVAERYEVDGIQGDDRLPAMPSEGGYSDFTRALHLRETGRDVPSDPREPAFLQWKADKLSDFAVRLHDAVKSADPALTVSMAPSIHPWSKEEYLQDWPEWLRRGAVDELLPQAYRWDIDAYRATVAEMVATFRENVKADGRNGGVALAPGIIIRSGSRYNGYDYVRQAIEINRSYGVEGEVYFFYEGLFELNGNLADSLSKHHYQSGTP
jgi:uncharacterized lipoprotein YddW (UPF0748 family)